jgi:Ca-activated chloride channel family protein
LPKVDNSIGSTDSSGVQVAGNARTRQQVVVENGTRPLADDKTTFGFQNSGTRNPQGEGYSALSPESGAYAQQLLLDSALRSSQGGSGGITSPFSPKLGGYEQYQYTLNQPGGPGQSGGGARVEPSPAPGLVGGDQDVDGFIGTGSNGRPPERRPKPVPPEITLRPGEELWVIERTHPRYIPPTDDTPGCGSLMTRREENGNWRNIPVPLAHTSVNAHIDGYVSTVRVQQQFHNPFDSKIEALYVFPLPEDAAVNDFLMTVGSRTIRGVIREREQAEKIYENARRQGYVASLMTQERPNIFTQAVANIEPGREIAIDIAYFHTLTYRDGAFEFVFPMVVGPRFNPPWTMREGSGVGAVALGAPGASGQQTEVQYLRPQRRTGTDISVAVDINAGVSIESLESPSHAISVQHEKAAPAIARVTLASSDTIPNKDFVLRFRVAGSAVKSAMLTQPDTNGRAGAFFSMLLVPPSDLSYIERGPVEVVFLIDRSGSMEGDPLRQAKAAVEHTLSRLDVDDTFQIIDFSDAASTIGEEPLKATRRNLEKGLAYIRGLSAGGGTMMLNGVKAALSMPRDRGRTRFVCFLTDGFIGNDPEVLGFVREHLGE